MDTWIQATECHRFEGHVLFFFSQRRNLPRVTGIVHPHLSEIPENANEFKVTENR